MRAVVIAICIYVAATATAGLIFSVALDEFATAVGLPKLDWRQSCCLLICLGIVGGAITISRLANVDKR